MSASPLLSHAPKALPPVGSCILDYWFQQRNVVVYLDLLQLPLCGPFVPDHFLCEVPALLKLSCVDTTANEAETFFVSMLFYLVPFTLIVISYAFIARAVLRIQSAGRQTKSIWNLWLPSTCGVTFLWYSHLHVPATTFTQSKDRGKMVSSFMELLNSC